MKKRILSLLFVSLSAILVSTTSCNKDEEGNVVITINGKAAETATAASAGDSLQVVIKSTHAWQAEAVEWATASPASGAANAEVNVTVVVSANTTGQERTGGVAFKAAPDNEFVELVITQAAQ